MAGPISQAGRPTSPLGRRRPLWRTILGIVVVIAVAIALAFVLSRCAKASAAKAPRGGRPAITVGVAKAVLGDVPIQLTALGTVTPAATVNVNARVAGMLVKVDFREGQMVRRGQLLAQIDPRPFQVAVQQAQGQLMRDQALLANAQVDLKRYQALLAQDSIARQQTDTQAALVKQDQAIVVSDRGALGAAQLNLSFTRIPSPVAGRVGLRQVDAGNQITANQATPIAVVAEIDPIDVVFAVPEDDIPAISKHSGGTGAGLPVSAYDRAGGTMLGQGALVTIDNVVDTTTGTVKGKARFANPTGALFPNQFVNVTVLVDTLTNQVIVPTTAVRHGPQGDFVYVLAAGQIAKVRAVQVGPATGETVSIVSGLKAGETVITEGGDRLRDGAKVVLPSQKPGAGGPGGRGRSGGHHRGGAAPAGGGAAGGGAPAGA